MDRRQILKKSPFLLLLGLFNKEPDNCGVKVTRREDGGIIIDGEECKLKRPTDGFQSIDGFETAIYFKGFTVL